MLDEMLFTLLVFAGVGLLFMALGLPLFYEKIKKNIWYGLRTKKTLSNDKIWYKANKYFGRDFSILGAVITIISLMFIPIRNSVPIDLIVSILLIFLMMPLFIIIIKSLTIS